MSGPVIVTSLRKTDDHGFLFLFNYHFLPKDVTVDVDPRHDAPPLRAHRQYRLDLGRDLVGRFAAVADRTGKQGFGLVQSRLERLHFGELRVNPAPDAIRKRTIIGIDADL